MINETKQKSPNILPSGTPTPATPPYLQLDNLVRRTSESNLVTGEASLESRPKSANVPRNSTAPDHQFNFNKLDLRTSVSTEDITGEINMTRDNSYKQRAFSSTTTTTSSQRSSVSSHESDLRKTKSSSVNTDLRSPPATTQDMPNSQQKKRLVVVDSGYIGVGTVEDSYTTVNRDNKPFANKSTAHNNRKAYNYDDSSSSASSNTLYHDDSVSLKPYDLSTIETTLPQDLSASSSSLPRDENTFYTENNRESDHGHSYGRSVPDGNVMATSSKSRSKHSSNRTESESSEHSSKDKTRERKKEKRKHKSNSHSSKHHKHHTSDSSHEHHHHSTPKNKNNDGQHLQEPAVINGVNSGVMNSYTPSNSDDNRSIDSLGSVGSVDELQLPAFNNNSSSSMNNNKDFNVLKSLKSSSHLYETSTDSSYTTLDKSLHDRVGSSSDVSTSSRTQSPQYFEGDARLVRNSRLKQP